MTTYHTFTKDNITYHIIDDFYPDDLLRYGDVYIRLTIDQKGGTSEYFCNILKDCTDCAVREVCSSLNRDRIKDALKLAPNLLTDFPELGV